MLLDTETDCAIITVLRGPDLPLGNKDEIL